MSISSLDDFICDIEYNVWQAHVNSEKWWSIWYKASHARQRERTCLVGRLPSLCMHCPPVLLEHATHIQSLIGSMSHAPTWSCICKLICQLYVLYFMLCNCCGIVHFFDYIILYVCWVCKKCISGFGLAGARSVFVMAWSRPIAWVFLRQDDIRQDWIPWIYNRVSAALEYLTTPMYSMEDMSLASLG
jgi:hypothetical protein